MSSDPTTNGTAADGFARDPDDFFAETRMSFGDHIEELRRHLWRAIGGLCFCLCIGFVLDAVGYWTDWPLFPGAKTGYLRASYWVGRVRGEPVDSGERLRFGIGVPLMQMIQDPVEEALKDYDRRQLKRSMKEADRKDEDDPANQPVTLKAKLSGKSVANIRGDGKEDAEPVQVELIIPGKEVHLATKESDINLKPRTLTTLSVQEALVVYFKVSLVAGLVIASPWVFWQIWAFVAAGLYPHEKKLVHVYLPISLGLFLAGVVVCQFLVMPQAVAAMLWFNEWLGIQPDLRLNEWLSFAIWMPVIFGVAFQTPLVMLFMGKLGIADVPFFASKRKFAYFGMAVFAAIITPSPDAFSMLALTVPMCLLYELGIILIKMQPKPVFEEEESEEMIEV